MGMIDNKERNQYIVCQRLTRVMKQNKAELSEWQWRIAL